MSVFYLPFVTSLYYSALKAKCGHITTREFRAAILYRAASIASQSPNSFELVDARSKLYCTLAEKVLSRCASHTLQSMWTTRKRAVCAYSYPWRWQWSVIYQPNSESKPFLPLLRIFTQRFRRSLFAWKYVLFDKRDRKIDAFLQIGRWKILQPEARISEFLGKPAPTWEYEESRTLRTYGWGRIGDRQSIRVIPSSKSRCLFCVAPKEPTKTCALTCACCRNLQSRWTEKWLIYRQNILFGIIIGK